MDNVLEGMKFLMKSKVYGLIVTNPCSFDAILDTPDYIESVRRDCDPCNCHLNECVNHCECEPEELELVKPLLKFPDKDSEGNDCWDCDLLGCEDSNETDDIYILFRDKDSWGNWTLDHATKDISDNPSDINIVLIRKCSLYDPNATDHLNQETIDKLKGVMEG